MTSDMARPRVRNSLYTSAVRGRFVVLDIESRLLAELHPDVRSLWPLLDGRNTLTQLAVLWPAAADAPTESHGLLMAEAVTDQLAEAGLLEPNTGEETT